MCYIFCNHILGILGFFSRNMPFLAEKSITFATQMRGHHYMNHYSKDTISKIGNSIIYLSQHIADLSKTKLLKLLYLLEECSVIKNKTPFFGIDFEVWQAGPVSKDIYIDLSNQTPVLLKDYIATQHNIDGTTYVSAKKEFIDDEFSDNDIEIMDFVISKYGNKTATQLVNQLHKKNTAWHNKAESNDLLYGFDNGFATSSDIKIDLSYYLGGCDSERYLENKETAELFNSLKH